MFILKSFIVFASNTPDSLIAWLKDKNISNRNRAVYDIKEELFKDQNYDNEKKILQGIISNKDTIRQSVQNQLHAAIRGKLLAIANSKIDASNIWALKKAFKILWYTETIKKGDKIGDVIASYQSISNLEFQNSADDNLGPKMKSLISDFFNISEDKVDWNKFSASQIKRMIWHGKDRVKTFGIQLALQHVGLKSIVWEADGLMGPRTFRALEAYQRTRQNQGTNFGNGNYSVEQDLLIYFDNIAINTYMYSSNIWKLDGTTAKANMKNEEDFIYQEEDELKKWLDSSDLREKNKYIQAILHRLWYGARVWSIDGKIWKNTKNAILDFQRDYNAWKTAANSSLTIKEDGIYWDEVEKALKDRLHSIL